MGGAYTSPSNVPCCACVRRSHQSYHSVSGPDVRPGTLLLTAVTFLFHRSTGTSRGSTTASQHSSRKTSCQYCAETAWTTSQAQSVRHMASGKANTGAVRVRARALRFVQTGLIDPWRALSGLAELSVRRRHGRPRRVLGHGGPGSGPLLKPGGGDDGCDGCNSCRVPIHSCASLCVT